MPRTKINQLKKPVSFTDEELIPKQEPKPVVKSYYCHPKLVEQVRSLGLQYSKTLKDISLDRFISSVDESTVRKEITACLLISAPNRLDPKAGKEKENKLWLVTLENWRGTDSNGHPIPPVSGYENGSRDFQIRTSRTLQEDGSYQYRQEGTEIPVYTLSFSKANVDKAIESCPETDVSKIQFLVIADRKYGNYTYDQFTRLDFDTLVHYGRTGQAGRSSTDPDIISKENELIKLREQKAKDASQANVTSNSQRKARNR